MTRRVVFYSIVLKLNLKKYLSKNVSNSVLESDEYGFKVGVGA